MDFRHTLVELLLMEHFFSDVFMDFWSSAERNQRYAYSMNIRDEKVEIWNYEVKENGLSVRCIKNKLDESE